MLWGSSETGSFVSSAGSWGRWLQRIPSWNFWKKFYIPQTTAPPSYRQVLATRKWQWFFGESILIPSVESMRSNLHFSGLVNNLCRRRQVRTYFTCVQWRSSMAQRFKISSNYTMTKRSGKSLKMTALGERWSSRNPKDGKAWEVCKQQAVASRSGMACHSAPGAHMILALWLGLLSGRSG